MDGWLRMKAGIGCPLCAPRPAFSDSLYRVCRLAASTLYLARDQTYRGACRLIFDPRHVNRIDELSAGEWQQLAGDLWTGARALALAMEFEHLNVASLGNEVPHLHWHLIPRRRDDGRWGAPIWSVPPAASAAHMLPEDQYAGLAERLRGAVGTVCADRHQPT